MKRKKIIIGLFCASTTLFVVSCGGSNDHEDIQNVQLIDSTEVVVPENETNTKVSYSVPTPNELFEIVKLQGGEQQLNLVNALANAENYVNTKSKSINFGVYSADVAYLSCFGIGLDFLKYFKKIEELGDELGISGAFDEDMMARIESNQSDTDSLFSLSNESYYESYLYLEENEKGVELSLIMAGGYVESLYIICNLIEEYNDENPIINKIGDQKIVLENLIDFISEYSDNPSVTEVITDLEGLSMIFEENMEFDESPSSVENMEDGMIVLSGGSAYKMNAAAFEAIKVKANELRTQYTN